MTKLSDRAYAMAREVKKLEAEASDSQKSKDRLLDQLREKEWEVRSLQRRAILALKRAGVPVGDIAEELRLSRDDVLNTYLYSKDRKGGN